MARLMAEHFVKTDPETLGARDGWEGWDGWVMVKPMVNLNFLHIFWGILEFPVFLADYSIFLQTVWPH